MGRLSKEVRDARNEFLSEWLKYRTRSPSLEKRWLKVYNFLVWRQDLVSKFTPSLIHNRMFRTVPWEGGKPGLSPELMLEIVQSPEDLQDKFLAALEEGKDSSECVSVRQVWNRVKGSFLYLIEDQHGNIKIGHSNDVTKRLKEFQTANSSALRITGHYSCKSARQAKKAEQLLHKACEKHRISGEWFRPSALETIEGVLHRMTRPTKKAD